MLSMQGHLLQLSKMCLEAGQQVLIAAANFKHRHVGIHCRQVELLVEAAEGCVTVPPEVYLCKATTQLSEAGRRAAALVLQDGHSARQMQKLALDRLQGCCIGEDTAKQQAHLQGAQCHWDASQTPAA